MLLRLFFLLVSFFTATVAFSQKSVVQPVKMNILYIGLDNPIRVAVEGYKTEDLVLTPSQGEIIKEGDHYKFLVNKHGDASLYISDKKGKALDTQLFRVRRIPKPELKYGTLSSGTHSFGAIAAQNALYAVLGSGFAYEGIRYTIISCSYLALFSKDVFGGKISKTNRLPQNINLLLKNRDWNLQRLIFSSAIVEGPDGTKKCSPINIIVREESVYYSKKGNLSNGTDIFSYDDLDATNESEAFWQIGKWEYYDPHGSNILLSTRIYGDSGELESEKNFYANGKLKSEFNASKALYISYHPNGKVEMTGPMMGPGDSIEFLRLHSDNSTGDRKNWDWGFYNKDTITFFPVVNLFVPIGNWQFYYPSGALRAKGTFQMDNYTIPPLGNDNYDIYYSEPGLVIMHGPWYFYDEKGKLRYIREY